MSNNIWPSNREPYHGDIVQGRLGNCFLIASLQALASCQPQLLKSIITISPLKCNFYRQGQQIEIPVTLEPITKEYQYCRSTVADVQWPYIIEQTYAQFYGGRFENLAGGNTSEAFYDLLGKPVEEFEPNDKGLWEKIENGLAEKTILVTCGAVVTNGSTRINTNNGLSVNHAYGILATFIYQRTREKFVLIHNPHGINHITKENIRAREAFFTSISKNYPLWSNTVGTQLVSWSELQRTCNRIQICYLNVESRQLLSGEWSMMTSGGCLNFATFYQNPFIVFPSSYSKQIILVLGHTTDQRQIRTTTDIKLNYAQLGITILKFKSHMIATQDNYDVIFQSKFWNKREVSLSIDIEYKQGEQYAAVLSTYYPNINSSFWIEIFSKKSLPTVEIRTWTKVFQHTIHGEWHRGNAGGRRNKSNPLIFYKNPAYLLTTSNSSSICLILHQSFPDTVPLSQHHPIGIYVLSSTSNEETTFVRARSVSRFVHLNADEEYYIIPACFDANSFGQYQLNILSDVAFTLDTTERKLPTPPPPAEDQTSTPTSAETASPTRKLVTQTRRTASPTRKLVTQTRQTVSSTRKPVALRQNVSPTRKAIAAATRTKETPTKGNLSTSKGRVGTILNDYSQL